MNPVTSVYWRGYRAKFVDQACFRSTLSHFGQNGSAGEATLREVASTIAIRTHNGTLPLAWDYGRVSGGLGDIERLWETLPIMTREGLRNQVRRQAAIPGSSMVYTGGSTGQPVGLALTRANFDHKRARLLAARVAMGWTPGMKVYAIWGSDSDIGRPDSAKTRLRHALASLHIDGGFTMYPDRWQKLSELMLKEKRPFALYGYSSLLADFARFCIDEGLTEFRSKVSTTWNGAEPIDGPGRAFINEAFGRSFHNFYGARETGALAVQLDPDVHDLTPLGPTVLIEVVDGAGLACVPGEMGRVLVSLLQPTGTPLLHYEIGDLAVAGSRNPIGVAGLPALTGRTNNAIPLSDGSEVWGSYFNHLLKDYPEIAEFQIIAKPHKNQIIMFHVGGLGSDAAVQIVEAVSERMKGYQVRLQQTSQISRTTHGKLRQVIVEAGDS